MNEQNFDHLFREKLATYTKTPPLRSMETLSKKLKQRRQKAWLKFARLAAALALVAVSIYLVSHWTYRQNEPLSSNIAGNQPATPVEQTITETPRVPKRTEVPDTENNQQAIASTEFTQSTDQRSAIDQSNQAALQVTQVTAPREIALTANIAPDDDQKPSVSEEAPNATSLAAAKSVPTKTKRGKVTITYKRASASEEPQLAMQEQSERKPKRLKRFLKKAQTVDYQSFSLAGIRATKDQLLAINKKEKNKETKSN